MKALCKKMLMLLGGCGQELAQHRRASGADITLVIDVAGQLPSLAEDDPDVVGIALGTGESLATICDHIIEGFADRRDLVELARRCRQLPITLAHGAGQIPAVGLILWEDFMLQGGEAFLVERVFNPLLVKAHGALAHVDVDVAFGLGGGMGRGAAEACVRDLTNVFLSRLDASFSVTMITVDSTGFLTCGPHIHRNCATGVLEYTDYVVRDHESRHARELRRMICIPLPLDQRNGDLRDTHVEEMLGPLVDSEARDLYDAAVVNTAVDPSGFGNSRIVAPQVFGALPAHTITSTVATCYRNEIEELLSADVPPKALCRAVEFLVTPDATTPVPDIQELEILARSSPQREPEGLREKAELIAAVKVGIRLRLDSGSIVGPSQLLADLAEIPASTAAYTDRAQRYAGLEAFLSEALYNERRELARKRRASARARRGLLNSLRALYPQGHPVQSLLAQFREWPARLQRFVRATRQFRQHAQATAEAEARVAALEDLAAQVRTGRAALVRRLEAVVDMLNDILSTIRVPQSMSLVRPRRLDNLFPDLLLSADLGLDHLKSTLGGAAETVTPDGLAAALGIPESALAQPDQNIPLALVQRLEDEEAALASPPWGFRVRFDSPEQRILVLPPIPSELRRRIEDALRARGKQIQVACRSNLEASAAIVLYTVYRVTGLEDMLTGIYVRALDELPSDGEQALWDLKGCASERAAQGGAG